MTQNTEKKNTVPVWTLFALLAVIVLAYLGFQYGQAMRGETSAVDKAKARAAEIEAKNPELAEKMRENAAQARAKTNLARIDVDPADLERENFNSGYASWTGLKPGMDQNEAEALLRESFNGEGEGVRATQVKTIYKSGGITAIVATQIGIADDSIAAQQVLAEFEPVSPTANRLVFYGQRHKCARGENTTEWTTKLCP